MQVKEAQALKLEKKKERRKIQSQVYFVAVPKITNFLLLVSHEL